MQSVVYLFHKGYSKLVKWQKKGKKKLNIYTRLFILSKKLRLCKYNGIIQKERQLDVIHWNSIGYSTIVEEKWNCNGRKKGGGEILLNTNVCVNVVFRTISVRYELILKQTALNLFRIPRFDLTPLIKVTSSK